MKFSNGCWLQKEGCECFAPQQVYFVEKEKSGYLCANSQNQAPGGYIGRNQSDP